MFRRVGVLASLAVVATMFAGISSAQAAPGDAFVCVFQGLAGDLIGTSPPTGTAGIPSAADDLRSGPPDDREYGTYHYEGPDPGTASCAGILDSHLVSPTDPAVIESNGEYENIVCGTGWAHDLDGAQTTITVQTATGTAQVTNFGYEIPFVAGNGPLIIGGDYAGTGAVHIHPASAPNDCATGPGVNAFTVAGSLVAVGVR